MIPRDRLWFVYGVERITAVVLLVPVGPVVRVMLSLAQIIDNLKSNLFFHGHPINRKEAKNDLNLKVIDADPDLEAAMWALYTEFESDLQLSRAFWPLEQLAAAGAGGATPPTRAELKVPGARFESTGLAHVFTTEMCIERVRFQTQAGLQEGIKQEVTCQGWNEETVPPPPRRRRRP